jgi:hypothetical protein
MNTHPAGAADLEAISYVLALAVAAAGVALGAVALRAAAQRNY